MKKVIAFDLDDTLTVTKQPIEARMAELLLRLIDTHLVAIITGGRYEQVRSAVVQQLGASPEQLGKLYLLPLSGALCYEFDPGSSDWKAARYFESLSEQEEQTIAATLERTARQLGYWVENPSGDIIEQRGSQVTYSALGQLAPPAAKYAWDPTYQKRQRMRQLVAEALPGYTVHVNGNTSLDITKKGYDKGYGMRRFLEERGLQPADVLFFGDQFQEGGNDLPIKELGVETVTVGSWQETADAIEAILNQEENTT